MTLTALLELTTTTWKREEDASRTTRRSSRQSLVYLLPPPATSFCSWLPLLHELQVERSSASAKLASPNPLSLSSLTPTSIPPPSSAAYSSFKSTLLDSSTALVRSLSSSSTEWKKGKTFNKLAGLPTATWVSKKPPGGGEIQGYKWQARISRHKERWETFREALLVDHSLNESQYIGDCIEAKRIQVLEEGVLEGALPFEGVELFRANCGSQSGR